MARQDYFNFKSLDALKERVGQLGLSGDIGFADSIAPALKPRLAAPLQFGPFKLSNALACHPMEGWDGDPATGAPTEDVLRRWERMGESGFSLLWGLEALAVGMDYRANTRQLVLKESNAGAFEAGLRRLRKAAPSRQVVGAQITCSGRYSYGRPKGTPPLLVYHHPELDKRLGAGPESRLMSDDEIEGMVGEYARAAKLARNLGFDFIDIKACHRYWLNETLAAKTRPGKYGGSFENRIKPFLMILDAVRRECGDLPLGTRLSACDGIPFEEDPATRREGLKGLGRPSTFETPYVWGWGVDEKNPLEADLSEPLKLAGLLKEKGVSMVNLTAGSPYSNPHFSRPTETPPVDGYQPHQDPLIEVAKHFRLAAAFKKAHPDLFIVGTGYSYLRHYKALAAEWNLGQGRVDMVGFGRAVLSYHDEAKMLVETGEAKPSKGRVVCTGDSACTTGPRLGLKSGCIFDPYYRETNQAINVKLAEMGLSKK